MAVKIKLKRMGKIRQPMYRIIVADARTKRDGRAIEEIGLYQPKQHPSLIQVNSERVQYWLSVGAQPTEPVVAILEVTGDWQRFKGLPGAEGRLEVPAPAASKSEVFARVLADTHGTSQGAPASPRRGSGGDQAAGAGAGTGGADAGVADPAEDRPGSAASAG